MAERWGRAYFPGLEQCESCSYTLAHGVAPGVAEFVTVPQRNYSAAGGTLTLLDGFTRIDLPECKVEKHVASRGPQGVTWQLYIVDRRWKWRFTEISGTYNLPYDERRKTVLDWMEKTPQELAELCLKAMGETNYDVRALPTDPRPKVVWQHDNAAKALQDLCEQFGCRVVYVPRINGATDRVVVAAQGEGQPLPTPRQLPAEVESLTIDPPERPDGIKVVGGPAKFQALLKLRAVGMDTDGTIKPIDDLSYRPDAGWEKCYPPFFSNVTRDPSNNLFNGRAEAERLTQETVFRWYQIVLEGTSTWIPGFSDDFGELTRLEQILPLDDVQVEPSLNPVEQSARPAQVWGIFYPGRNLEYVNATVDANGNTRDGALYKGGFSVEKETGIVKFGEYVFQYVKAGGTIAPADLRLLTSVSVRHPENHAFVTYERRFDVPGPKFGTGDLIVKVEELVYYVQAHWDSNYASEIVETSLAENDQEAEYHYRAALKEFETKLPQAATYAGLHPLRPDGAIQQVTWRVGLPDGASTEASRNSEHSLTTPPYRELLRRQVVAAALAREEDPERDLRIARLR